MFYVELFQALNDHGVKYAVVGGLAMNLQGIPRLTMDIDILMAFEEDNVARLSKACEQLHLAPALPIAISDLANSQKRKAWHAEKNMKAFALTSNELHVPTVDILIDPAADPETVIKNANVIEVQGVQILVASVPELIRLKSLAGREQDQADLLHLKRIMEGTNG